MTMPLALLALAIGGFGIGLTEFVIMGLLPEVATDFGVTETVAGYLISGCAVAVAIGAILVTVALSRVNRKFALIGLAILFIIGNALSAPAPSYEAMMLGRIVAVLCHGAIFGIGSVVAASLVAPNRQAAAISMMFAGLTGAIIALIGIAVLIPAATTQANRTGGLLGEFWIFASGQVWVSIILTVLGYGGMFGAFTYMAFTLTGVSGFAASTLSWLLVLLGVGLFIGNVLGGRAADRKLGATLLTLLIGFATVPALQMRIMGHSGDAQTLGSGANIAAGLGYASPLWAGALVTVGGLAILLLAGFARGGQLRRAGRIAVDVDEGDRIPSSV